MHNRRSFLIRAGAMAAALGMPFELLAQMAPSATPAKPLPAPKLPDPGLYDRDQEAYWTEVRKLFLIPEDEVYLNNGTVGSCPKPVIDAVVQGYEQTEKLEQTSPEDYPIWGYGEWNEFRDPLAQFVGAKRQEIAIVRNATEANNFMINGLDMKAGEEIITSDQEHPSGNGPLDLKAKRYGIVIRRFEIPKPANSPEEILNRINDLITPKTRAIFVSHVTTTTGVVLPVKEISALARSKGIVSMIDGAQAIGMMKVNVANIGCDIYGSSPHKWLMAPKGSGLLYVRDEVIDRIWSTVTTAGWDDPKSRAARFQQVGSSNVPSLWGYRAAIDFANRIGMERIEKRHRQMMDYLHGEMMKRDAEAWTSTNSAMRCGMSAVNTPPIEITRLEPAMWEKYKIRIRGGAPYKIRLSTPYYLLRKDVDRFLAKFDEYKAQNRA